ncbi:phospholipase ytpA [Anoxybacillus sp. B7M1]|jgi:lysophospholipase|uniref:alpha/beta hydrolase n=1 Tax=Anoxybacillaceae TaxID=3120669 RepID=UPI0005CD26AA|nr:MULTISPECIES: alpha/beta hydrolase [Anoxybacillus]ANB58376.1 phospholipase ytpA [Anoxybacillus sp. B2M1]ANB65154.1 phospholipase ytpA [Anoxybacillus sp. B7M1]MBS2771487.1 alpha/beta hydrolase [Anoxybacillus rupiensis]
MWKWEAEQAKAVVVIVHGAAEHHGRYKWLIEMFRLHGFHVVMGDLPGQGTTTRRKRGHIGSFDEYINEVADWIKAAQAFQLPIFLLGHSMGGLVVIRALQEKRLPVKGAILSSPCLGLVTYPSKGLDLLSKVLNHIAPSMLFDSGLSVEAATRNEEVREMDKNDSLYVTKVSVRWYRELVKAMQIASRKIHKISDIPLLLMQGGNDKIVDKVVVKEWFDKLPVSEKVYKEWNLLYHEIFNEPEREAVFLYAKAFLETQLQLQKTL